MGTKIKDAQLLENLTGNESIPISDGSGNPKRVLANQLKNIPVVDSEDKLDSLGLKQGQIAAVAVDTIETKRFSELYQPISDASSGLFPFDFYKYSKIKNIEVILSDKIPTNVEESVIIATKKYFTKEDAPYFVGISTTNGFSIHVFKLDGSYNATFTMKSESGEEIVNQEAIKEFNDILFTDEVYFLGKQSENITYIDSVFRIIEQKKQTNLFISNKNSFNKIIDEISFDEFKNSISTIGRPIIKKQLNFNATYPNFIIGGNTYYIFDLPGNNIVTFVIADNSNLSFLEEFSLEIICREGNHNISFLNNITWENDTPPAFEPNTIVRISIINGLATYKVFPMST